MDNRFGIIYKATSPSKKIYIGQTIQSLEQRIKGHVNNAKTGKKTKFCRAIRKYGKKIKWEVLYKDVPKKYLNKMEKWAIAQYDSFKKGYNSDLGGNVKTRKQLQKTALWGEKNKAAKINTVLVDKIRTLYAQKIYTYADISKKLNNVIKKQTVGKIVRNERWQQKDVKYTNLSGRGERNSHAKLTKDEVKEIRYKYSLGIYTHPQLAREYGVKTPAIFKIIHNITWKE